MQKPSASSSESGVKPNEEAGSSRSVLLLASGFGEQSLPLLRTLIEGEANVKHKHPNGFTRERVRIRKSEIRML